MSVRQGQTEQTEQECVDTWDQGTKLTSHPSLLRAVRTGKGTEEPALGPAKGSRGQGQPAETQSSDVIGKSSNQGSRRVSTYPLILGAQPQPAAVLGS